MLIVGGVCGVAALAAGIWAWTPDRPRIEVESKYLDASTAYRQVLGTTLRVRDTGPSGGSVILMLHGFGSSLETWEPWARALSTTHRVVRFDLPGCGLSEPDRTGDYGDARTLGLIAALLDQLGVDRAAFIGNSMGGRIAWKFAAQFPTRVTRLVLISPDGFASPGFEYGKAPRIPWPITLMKYFLPRALVRANLAAAYADPSRLSEPEVDRYYELLLAPGNRAATIERMRQMIPEDPVPMLRRIEAPTLLLWGERDRLIPFSNAADYLRALPHARLVAFPDLGHVPQEEAPAESLQPLVSFLSG